MLFKSTLGSKISKVPLALIEFNLMSLLTVKAAHAFWRKLGAESR